MVTRSMDSGPKRIIAKLVHAHLQEHKSEGETTALAVRGVERWLASMRAREESNKPKTKKSNDRTSKS